MPTCSSVGHLEEEVQTHKALPYALTSSYGMELRSFTSAITSAIVARTAPGHAGECSLLPAKSTLMGAGFRTPLPAPIVFQILALTSQLAQST